MCKSITIATNMFQNINIQAQKFAINLIKLQAGNFTISSLSTFLDKELFIIVFH